jgi:iron(II)-dependent oxidoreductase
VGAYRKRAEVPKKLQDAKVPDDFPVSHVTFDQAMRYAEAEGKRLPVEEEYEYAATARGQHAFPWGNFPPPQQGWSYGPVGGAPFDRLTTNPAVVGLFSNVAEWTASWNYPYPSSAPNVFAVRQSPEMKAIFDHERIVRGGPYWIVEGKPAPQDPQERWLASRTEFRTGYPREASHPGLGFRCARSARPRFLDD